MRALLAIALLALAFVAAPASAATGDLDSDGCPDLLPALDAVSKEHCRAAWAGASDTFAQVRQACASQAQAACDQHPLDEVAGLRKDQSADCWNRARALAGTTGVEGLGRVCVAVGDLDGDGLVDVAASACPILGGPDGQACVELTAMAKSKHDAAMAAIQNTR